jgi:hypothetical protein
MELNFIVQNLVGKNNNNNNKFKMLNVRWFVYPRIMNKSNNMVEEI